MHHLRRNKRKNHDLKEVFAAIDLGTNSCRLLIGKYDGYLRIIDSYSKVVRLGENIKDNDELSEEAIERTLKALALCQEKIRWNRVTNLRAVTTEACRHAKNSHILIDRAKSEIGIDLEVISPETEANLAISGCAGMLQRNIPYAIAFDIGGGSTEVMWIKLKEEKPGFHVLDVISLPFGVVTLSDQFGSFATSPQIYEEIRKKIAQELIYFSEKNNIPSFIEKKEVQMIGTSGTVTTLAAIHLKLQRYDRHIIDGIYFPLQDIPNIAQHVLHMPIKNRNDHPGIGMGRADLVITGAAILEGICDAFDLPYIRIADRGVREGILLGLIQDALSERETEMVTATAKTMLID
jgi:exopolyphosphatase/guanosine-5'-triphosphate,3'-diphosphate pyrophosphatase